MPETDSNDAEIEQFYAVRYDNTADPYHDKYTLFHIYKEDNLGLWGLTQNNLPRPLFLDILTLKYYVEQKKKSDGGKDISYAIKRKEDYREPHNKLLKDN